MSKMSSKWIVLSSVLAVAGSIATLSALGVSGAQPEPQAAPKKPADAKTAGERKVLYWWDPMLGPSSVSDHPGKSAMNMDLVPVYESQTSGGPEITIDSRVTQVMGVQTAAVSRGPLRKTIRAVGVFELPQPGLHDMSLKVGGWIDKLFADQEGMGVVKGEQLFAVYSPELQVAAQELISAVQSAKALGSGTSQAAHNEAQKLIESSRRKLQLWDVADADIDAIAAADQPPRDIVFRSPATGHIEEKMVVQGSSVQAGMKLLRISDHAKLWLNAQVYEEQIPWVKVGQAVEATSEAVPGKTFKGTITFVYPHLDHMVRTLTARATIENEDFALRPGMYGEANLIAEPSSDALLVPQEAVIDTGTQQIVFMAQGDGHFTPRTVRTGLRGDDDLVQILEGLTAGETVVTSGQFLMDVESRTQEAIAKLRGGSPAAPPPAAPSSAPSTPAPAAEAPAPPAASQPAAQAHRLSLLYCPMAKVQWVQSPGKVDNPYLGPDMQTCGEVQSDLPAPSKDSPLAPVAEAYLKVQHPLATGQLDGAAVRQLKAATDRLSAAAHTDLRAAVDKLATITDVKTAQEQFKAVSKALIPLLR